MDPMALPWQLRFREFIAVLAIVAFLSGFGLVVYRITSPEGSRVKPATGKVVGFSIDASSGKRTIVTGPQMIVDFQLDDGRRWSRRLGADQAAHCRVGQTVELGWVTTRGGGQRLVVPADPCRSH